LVSRPEMRRALGARAREWVDTECTWPQVARRYADFLERIASNGSALGREAKNSQPEVAATPGVRVEPEYILSWAPDESAKG
jgi:hypothetical protein